MDILIHPAKLNGRVKAIPSKSQAHRILICAAFSDRKTTLICPATNQDIEATVNCLRALGAVIHRVESGYVVEPVVTLPEQADLYCGESGSTLRFLLPVVGALGVDALFHLEGRLHMRPLSPLWDELEAKGCRLSRPSTHTIRCQGKLNPGEFIIDGGVSSQFISGILFASALIFGDSSIQLTGKVESAPYIDMTRQVMSAFGIDTTDFNVHGGWPFHSPGCMYAEGDWSNAAFFLASNAMGSCVEVMNLHSDSLQGDRAAADLIPRLCEFQKISAENIPDLIPILSVVACANCGAVFTETTRLRLKESDRVESILHMLDALGCHATADHNSITIYPGKFKSGVVETYGDHRIAMAAAIAATSADGPVKILNAECVSKSYPGFWNDYAALGGKYEQYIR